MNLLQDLAGFRVPEVTSLQALSSLPEKAAQDLDLHKYLVFPVALGPLPSHSAPFPPFSCPR